MKITVAVVVIMLYMLNSYAQQSDNIMSSNYESRRGSRVAWARGKFIVKSNSRNIKNWDWYIYPDADLKFLEQLTKNTSVNMLQDWNVVSFKKLDHMVAFPLIFLTGEHFVDMHSQEEKNLKEYLLRGGMIFVDDCVWKMKNYFYLSMITKLKKIFPKVVLKSYKRNHEIFKYYYKFDGWIHYQGINTGITFAYYNNKLIAILNGSDMHCGWVGAGWFKPFPKRRNQSYKMGINIYLYSMCN